MAEGVQKVRGGMAVDPKPLTATAEAQPAPAAPSEVSAMSKFFINHPIVAIVISIMTVIIGIVPIVRLPIAQYPELAPPEILLQTNYVGADAQTVEQSVATPIEQQIQGVDNMIYMTFRKRQYGTDAAPSGFRRRHKPNDDQILTQMRYLQAESHFPADVRNYGVTILKSRDQSAGAVFSLFAQGNV